MLAWQIPSLKWLFKKYINVKLCNLMINIYLSVYLSKPNVTYLSFVTYQLRKRKIWIWNFKFNLIKFYQCSLILSIFETLLCSKWLNEFPWYIYTWILAVPIMYPDTSLQIRLSGISQTRGYIYLLYIPPSQSPPSIVY